MRTVAIRDVGRDGLGWSRWQPIWAVAGVILLAWLGWSVVAWLFSAPHEVRVYRDGHSLTAVAASLYEIATVIESIAVLGYLYWLARRRGRVPFDAFFCLAAASLVLLDPIINFVQPLFLFNSDFINLRSWLPQIPFVLNPVPNGQPEPILVQPLFFAFGLPLIVILLDRQYDFVLQRYPALHPLSRGAILIIMGTLADASVSIPPYLLHLMAFPGSPKLTVGGLALNRVGGPSGYPIITQGLLTGCLFAIFTVIRRGWLVHYDSPDLAPAGSVGRSAPRNLRMTLALIGAMMTSVLVLEAVQIGAGLVSSPYPKMPASLVNGICSAPGIGPTPYGVCPGGTGYVLRVKR